MGTSSTFGTSNSHVKYNIKINQNWQSVEGNYSNVSVWVDFWRDNSGYTTYGSGTCYCKINGTTYSASVSPSQKITSSGITLYSQTLNIYHENNGSKNLSVSAWISMDTPLSSSEQGFSEWLTTIPRVSSISSINGNTIGSSITVNISRASSSFTHKVDYVRPDGEHFLVGENVGTSCAFTPALSDCNYIPNSTSATARIVVYTYSGGTYIGSSSKDFTLYVPSSVVPTINSVTLTENTPGIANKFGCYVQGKSTIKGVISASGIYSSTVKSYSISINSQSFSGSSFTTSPLTGSGTCTVKITDSRNRTESKNVSYSVVSYANPTINNFIVKRCNKDGTENDEGTYAKCTLKATLSSVNNKNDKTFQLLYKKPTDSSYITINLSNSNYFYDNTQIIAADINSEYEFIFRISDYFSTLEKSLNLGTAFTLVDYNASGRSIAFGRVSTATSSQKKMQIKLDTEIEGTLKLNNKTIFDLIYPVGSIYMSTNNTNPKNLFGGTWEQIQDKFLLSAGSTYAAETTGGSASHTHTTQNHTLTVDEMPNHTHGFPNAADEASYNIWCYMNTYRKGTTGFMDYAGAGQPHNHGNTGETSNLPPYLTVYMWKRIT